MRTIRRFREDHRRAWGIACGLFALAVALGAVVAFAMGTCHDAGGFCAQEFGSTHVEAYATAAVLAGLAAASATSAFTLRMAALVASLSAGALVTALLAIVGESVA